MKVLIRKGTKSESRKTKNYWMYVCILSVPLINGIASVTTNYFPPSTLNPGFIRIVILILYVLFLYPRAYISNITNNFIIVFVLYWIALLPFTSNLSYNLIQSPKVLLSLLMFPLGYYFINSIEKFNNLLLTFLISWSFFILNFYIGNFFRIGLHGYGGESSSLYFGSGGINISKAIVTILLIIPFYLKINESKTVKWMAIILAIIAFPVLLISLKRAALLGLGTGLIVYFVFTRFKRRVIILAAISTFIMYLSAPLYMERFIEVVEIRERSLDIDDPDFIEQESRFGEVKLVLQKFKEGSIKHKLFGTDVIYNNYLYGGMRMLHTDYMVLLYGTGIIGFIWYFTIYILIIYKYKSYKSHTEFYKEGLATLFALIAASMMISIAGSIGDLNLRSLFFLFAGGLIGTARRIYLQEKIHLKNIATVG